MFPIQIKTLNSDNPNFIINIKLADTLANLHAKIYTVTNLDGGSYELVFQSKPMDLGVSMAAYYLDKNSVVHLVLSNNKNINEI